MSLKHGSREHGRRITCEGPTVVGMLMSTLESGGSIDSAIRGIAMDGPELSRCLFDRAVRDTDVRIHPNLTSSLMSILSTLDASAEGYRRSIHMVLVAAESSDDDECSMLLKESSETSLESVRMMGEGYSASLNAPCMMVFGIGIMVPMLLMSVLPLLGISGMFSIAGMDDVSISVITLVLIPTVLLGLCLWLRNSNPFLDHGVTDIGRLLPLLLSLPLCMINYLVTGNVRETVILGIAPAIILALVLDVESHREEVARGRCVVALKRLFTDIGNRMQNGINCERAIMDSLESEPGCKHLTQRIRGSLSVHRDKPSRIIRGCVSDVSEECAISLRDICICAEHDNRDGGRLAMLIGREYRNRASISDELSIRLKGMTDMMFATATLFAPLVLGMSVAMMGPLTEITGYDGMENTSTILSVYLVELCALISMLVSSLRIEGVHGQGLWRFCTMVPVSLLMFTVCSAIPLN